MADSQKPESDQEENTLIQDLSTPRHYTMFPRIVVEMSNLSHTAVRLYLWYKSVCGQDGQCYQSLTTISKGCSMRRAAVIKSRKELEEVQLITIKRKKKRDGSERILISIVDVWKENNEKHDKERRGYDRATESPKAGYDRGTGVVRSGYPNKIKGNKIKEEGTRRTSRRSSDASPNGFFLTEWDRGKAAILRELLHRYGSELVQPPRQIRLDTLAKNFTRLRTERRMPEDRIEAVLDWLSKNYDDSYTPEIHKGDDFSRRFNQFEKAMKRWNINNGQPTGSRTGAIERIVADLERERGKAMAKRGEESKSIYADWSEDE